MINDNVKVSNLIVNIVLSFRTWLAGSFLLLKYSVGGWSHLGV